MGVIDRQVFSYDETADGNGGRNKTLENVLLLMLKNHQQEKTLFKSITRLKNSIVFLFVKAMEVSVAMNSLKN